MENNNIGCFKPVSEYLNNEETTPSAPKKSDKNIILSVSLLMRLMEFAKEDAKDDVALHQVLENIMAFSDGTNPLTIAEYDNIVADATGSSLTKDEEVEPEDKQYYDVSDFEDVEINPNAPVNDEQGVENCCSEETSDDCQCDNPEVNQLQQMLSVMKTAPLTYSIDMDNGNIADGCPECQAQETLGDDIEQQIAELIKSGKIQ